MAMKKAVDLCRSTAFLLFLVVVGGLEAPTSAL
jgi:hypothetical protein